MKTNWTQNSKTGLSSLKTGLAISGKQPSRFPQGSIVLPDGWNTEKPTISVWEFSLTGFG
jgi:hypothetical protein